MNNSFLCITLVDEIMDATADEIESKMGSEA